MPEIATTAHRGRLLHCVGDPESDGSGVEFLRDGLMLVENGCITRLGPAVELMKTLSGEIRVVDHHGKLIIPGLIDCHVHYPQVDVIASYGEQLLDWLNNYTFPAEAQFADQSLADATADFFLDELLRNGTTSALVFATVHPQSVDALFAAAQQRNMRIAAGKVLMDRNCPANLQDTAEAGYADSRRLLEQWHGQARLRYAITPRFAPTSSAEQLAAAGRLAAEFPEVMVHTHLAENVDEVAWVAKLFPQSRSYLDVYRQSGLLRERAVFAHCLHLEDQDYALMSSMGGAMAFCPTSNLFLGSGLFDLSRARRQGIRVGLGTDVGGGTSFSLLRTMGEAYKTLQLNHQSLSSYKALYLTTLGAAQALSIDDKVGNFARGKEADFVVLNAEATPLMKRRLNQSNTPSEEMFVQMILGDDRSIHSTYVMGECAYSQS